MGSSILTVCYLIAAVSFILGLKMLSHPESARKGNTIAASGMLIGIFGTIFLYKDDSGNFLHNYLWIFAGLAVGATIGAIAARKVKMTAMPEMVSIFNGMGGACAALISIAEFNHLYTADLHGSTSYPPLTGGTAPVIVEMATSHLLIIVAGLVIGTVSFAGSVIAWGKLNGRIRDLAFKGQHLLNLIILAVVVVVVGYFVATTPSSTGMEFTGGISASLPVISKTSVLIFYLILILALLYGIGFVLPIGGADMPVVISLLNSFTGVAAACGGFLYDNKAMLTGGILVGAAGTLLTILMCRAMNRSLKNVLIGSFGASPVSGAVAHTSQGSYKEIAVSDAAMLMNYAHKVMIVPGYGLAVAQAQHACHELEKLLIDKGVDVKYAIHPVAGRMPGHMNVLLAEADVSYDNLLEMEQANEQFPTTDVVLVLGANDVVNPAAKTDPASPIYGMPILDVQLAKACIVNKRSMKPGYAGIENDLFFQPKTSMLFGDAKKVLQDLIAELKNM